MKFIMIQDNSNVKIVIWPLEGKIIWIDIFLVSITKKGISSVKNVERHLTELHIWLATLSMFNVHENVKNYECESCPKSYYDRRNLERHIRNNLCTLGWEFSKPELKLRVKKIYHLKLQIHSCPMVNLSSEVMESTQNVTKCQY